MKVAYNRSEIMKRAWEDWNLNKVSYSRIGLRFADCLRRAWAIAKEQMETNKRALEIMVALRSSYTANGKTRGEVHYDMVKNIRSYKSAAEKKAATLAAKVLEAELFPVRASRKDTIAAWMNMPTLESLDMGF